MARARTVPWDIYEEHFEEASFLYGQWETALVAPNYTLDEVTSGPEERLRAHLDGLVLGGKAVAEKLLLPALAGEEPEPAFAAAWSLLHAEDADHFPAVIAALTAGPTPVRTALARALELGERLDLVAKMTPLWDHDDPFVKSVVLDVLAWRHAPKASEHLREAFASQDATLLSAALRALRTAPDVTHMNDVAAAAERDDAGVRAEAIATAHALSLSLSGATYRDGAAGAGPAAWNVMALLALRDEPLVHALLEKPELRRAATWALGFAGTVSAGDRLASLLEDEEVGAIAADALGAMSGLVIGGPFARPGERQGVEVEEEVGLDEPPPEVRREDDLPLPSHIVGPWWSSMRARFAEGTAYLAGSPRNRDTMRAALARGAMWRRPTLALEIAAIERAPVVIDVRAWTARQRIVAR
jgi:uncharacterized protein (TIGR02270 family)